MTLKVGLQCDKYPQQDLRAFVEESELKYLSEIETGLVIHF